MKPHERFNQLVFQRSQEAGISYDSAFVQVANERRDLDLLSRAHGATGQKVKGFNAGRGIGQGRAAIANSAEAKARKKQAQDNFQDRVSDHMRATGADYDRAFAHCQKSHVALWNEATGNTGADATETASAVPAVGLAQHFDLFRMPVSSSQEEFNAAVVANGNVMTPVNPGKIFDGLVQYWQAKQGGDYEAVLASCKQKYPDLWRDVETLAKTA